MSKDTINPKRWILDEKQLDDLLLKQRENCQRSFPAMQHRTKQISSHTAAMQILGAPIPPLPNPVEIPSDEEIEGMWVQKEQFTFKMAWINGGKFLRDLIFNKQ